MGQLRSALLLFAIIAAVSAFNPDIQNAYHLFTRANPSVSQPVVLNGVDLLANSNFHPQKRTAILVHGFLGSATAPINSVCVPAYLAAADMNVFVMDWSAGSGLFDGIAAQNAIPAGESLARFINWVVAQTGTSYDNFHLVGHSLGAHLAGVAGRNTFGRIPYLTALDPGANMRSSGHILTPDVAIYTESIHTNADLMGHGRPLSDVDFYPNGGDLMPGCGVNFLCNHDRAIHYFAESLTGGNFIGRSCGSYTQARMGMCFGSNNLRMGGLDAKPTALGIFHLSTNRRPPFARG